MRRIRTLAFAAAALVALSAPVHATWSIILVNAKTGEVAVGGATCITQFGLK